MYPNSDVRIIEVIYPSSDVRIREVIYPNSDVRIREASVYREGALKETSTGQSVQCIGVNISEQKIRHKADKDL